MRPNQRFAAAPSGSQHQPHENPGRGEVAGMPRIAFLAREGAGFRHGANRFADGAKPLAPSLLERLLEPVVL
jgi:hypothetical protein